MSEANPNPDTPPSRTLSVEVVDQHSEARVTALVESAIEGHYVLRFDRGTAIPAEARIRWFDGDEAWQAVSRLERLDETRASFQLHRVDENAGFQLASKREWKIAPARRSARTPVNTPMLVEIVDSTVMEASNRVHAVCLDISESGCRASWPGLTPRVGDAVKVTWEVGRQADAEPRWVSARVARVVALPFSGRHVAFTFEIADAMQAARVRSWCQAWKQGQRLRDQHAA